MNRLTAVVVTLAFLGCGVPSPKEVAAQTAADSRSLIREALETGQLTNTWSSIDEVTVNTGMASSAASRPHMPEATIYDASLDTLSKYSDRLFDDSNVVERPFGGLVFAVPGAIVCSSPDGTQPGSPECIKNTNAMQLRIKVTGNLDFTVQVGPEHLEPVVLRVHGKDSLSVEVDLDAMQRSFVYVNGALGQASPTNGQTLVSKGKVEIKLQRNGDHDFTLSYSNLAAISARYSDASGHVRTWNAEAKSPVASVRVEGLAKKLTALLDEGSLEVSGPSSDFGYTYYTSGSGGSSSQALPSVPMSFFLGGLSAQLNLQDGKSPTLTRLGLGSKQSTITYDGKKLLAVDLNASMGHQFDVTGKTVGSGMRLDFSPGVEAVVYTGFAALPSQANANANFLDATYTGSFKASSGPASLQVTPSTGTTSSSTKILSGVLRLASSQAGQTPREFSADTCLKSGSGSSAAHPVLDLFAPTPCQ